MAPIRGTIVLLMVLCMGENNVGIKVPMVTFQTGPMATTNSYLDSGIDGLPSLSQFSLLTRIMIRRAMLHVPLLSYAVDETGTELLIELVPTRRMLHVRCCGGAVAQAVSMRVSMNEWFQFGLSVNLIAKHLVLNYDNETIEVEIDVNLEYLENRRTLEIQGGGRLVVGQNIGDIHEEFNILELMDGELADYRVYGVALSYQQLLEWVKCRSSTFPIPPLISLDNGKLTAVGDVALTVVELDKLCTGHFSSFVLLFTEKMDFPRAEAWCRIIGGSLILPKDAVENEKLWNATVAHKNACSSSWTYLTWLGVVGDPKTLEWRGYSDNTSLAFSNFLPIYKSVSEEFQCAATVSHSKYRWAAGPCDMETCTLCQFTSYPRLVLRGLCKFSLLDRKFTFHESEDFHLHFEGLSHVEIVRMNESWTMISRRYSNLFAQMIERYDDELPMGVHGWKVSGDKCQNKEPRLLLTSCLQNEYTCDNGHCIPKDKRCDLSLDCPDKSDEADCDRVALPPGYSSKLPPPRINSQPLPILTFLTLRTIRELNLATFRLAIDLQVQMKWKDTRLQFRNLQADHRSNKLNNYTDVWAPSLKLIDGTYGTIVENILSKSVFVIKQSDPLPDDDTSIFEDYRYDGFENMLLFQEEMTVEFACYFDLVMYPFDQQQCYLMFEIHDYDLGLGYLIKEGDGVKFLGKRRLLEYMLYRVRLYEFIDHNASHVGLELRFSNQFRYYIGNIFLPSLMLVVLCYVTLLFDLSDFNDRIMVSITSLLVLVTFYTDTSESIPNTAYFKLIDVWFMSLMLEDFFIILSIIYIQELRERAIARRNSSLGRSTSSSAVSFIRVRPLSGGADSLKKPPVEDHSMKDDDEARIEKRNTFFICFFAVTLVVVLVVFIPLAIHGLTEKIQRLNRSELI